MYICGCEIKDFPEKKWQRTEKYVLSFYFLI